MHLHFGRLLASAFLVFSIVASEANAAPIKCPTGVDPEATKALGQSKTEDCETKVSHGYLLPDPTCTPGAINPTVTTKVLQSGKFRTGCERNVASSAAEKNKTYSYYSIKHPTKNTGASQTCELDHLISLELGGADTVDNIWPQCGPKGVKLPKRYFKVKDGVENYLAAQVKAGEISLEDAQNGIAENWTQYIAKANAYFLHHSKKGFGSDQ